jgi:formylglycine-generating enzyme required for sulfatase activity
VGESAPAATPQISGATAEEMAAMKKRLEEMEKKLSQQAKPPKPSESPKVTGLPSYSQPKQTGKEITGKDGAPMVLVPAGEFIMGSNDGGADEKPERRVTLEAFYMDKYEVTTTRYAAFMQATGRKEPGHWNEVRLASHGDRPVVGVTWHDADAYCRHYSKRLPTEQEWEKAARGTDGRKYPWGNDEPTSLHANFGKSGFNDYGVLVNVGSLEEGKSPYGIYDMAGNVWEWTSSDYDSNNKVLRGGSWLYVARYLVSTYRNRNLPTLRTSAVGFRCAQDAR